MKHCEEFGNLSIIITVLYTVFVLQCSHVNIFYISPVQIFLQPLSQDIRFNLKEAMLICDRSHMASVSPHLVGSLFRTLQITGMTQRITPITRTSALIIGMSHVIRTLLQSLL